MATVKAFDGKKVSYKSQANNGGVPVTFDGKKVSFAKPQYQYQQDFIGPVRIEDTPMGAIMEQNKAYEQARHNAIYGNTDVSNYRYQTVEEYDAEIAKLEEAYATQPKQNSATSDMAPSAAMYFSMMDTPQGKEIKAQIDALKAQRNLLERALFIGNKYGIVSKNADFDAKSGVARHDEDMTYVAVNRDAYSQFPEEYNDIGWVDGGYVTTENMAELAQKYGWSTKEATQRLLSADMLRQENEQREAETQVARKSNEFAMLTNDERAVYNYLYNVSGKNAANEYLDDMKAILEQRYTTAEQLDNIDRYDRAGDFGKAVMNIATIPANLVGALVAAINDVSEGVVGKYSPYGTAHSLQNYADTIRGETATDINEAVKNAGGGDTVAQLAGTLYQATMSGADAMLGGAALSHGYLAVAGANAATHKAKELYENGAEGWQIAVGSVASGALEAAIEKLPLDNLLAMKNVGGADNLSAILKNILKQSGLEGSEEAITELANLATDCILQGGNSDLSRQIAAYESEGHSSEEARKMAMRDKAADVLWATVAGMGSGGGSAAVFSTIGYGNMLRDTAKLGKSVLAEESGLEKAIGIGLNNARTTEMYKTARQLEAAIKSGNTSNISAYQVGKMLRDSQTADARKARVLDHTVRQSAAQYDVADDVTDMVADIAAGTGRQIVFGDLTEFDGEIDEVGGQYDPETGLITISPRATTERVVNFLTKHEITHSVEGTQQWNQLADIVQAQLGDEKWSDAISEVMERYAANGKELDLPHAEYEVVADWIGENLYKSGFAQAIVNGDATVGNAFVQAIDKMRLALGNKKSRSHTNLAVVERLFMRALENEVQTREGSGEYAFIGKLKDGTRVYESENKTISVEDAKEEFKNRIATIFNLGAVELKTDTKKLLVRGDKFTVNKNVYGDTRATETDMEAKYRMLYDMADILSTATYMPSKTQPEPSYINPRETPKNAAHKDVKYWYKFQNDIVLNEVGYTVTFNIRDKGKEQYQYLIEVKENGHTVSHTAIEGLRRTYRASTNTRLSQNDPRVNTQSMQNGKKNSSSGQLSFLPPEMAETGKPDVYQEEGERDAYLAGEGRTDNPSVSHSADTSLYTREAEQNGAIDENGEQGPQLSFTADFEADVIERFGITKMNDYIHVQKQVKEALPDSFFVPVENQHSGKTINITRKGVKETFNEKNYGRIPHSLQIAKLATVELIPDAIANGTYVMEVPNYHEADSPLTYAYIYYDIELQGQPCQLKIDVRRSSQSDSNRLHVHSVILTNENADGIPEDVHKNETRAKLPSATEIVYTDDENLSSAKQDDEYELDEEDLYRQRDVIREEKRTKAERAALEANRKLLEQLQNGDISESVYLERVEDLRREAVVDNDQKWRRGYRGSEAQRTTVQDARRMARDELREKQDRLDQEHADRRAREQQRRESKERTEKRNQLNREIDSLQSRLLNPKDGRSVPKELVQPCVVLLSVLQENSADTEKRLAELDEKIRKERDPDKYKRLQKQRDNLLERAKGLDTKLLRLKKLYAQYAQTDTVDGVPVESDAYAAVIKMIDLTIEQVGDRSIKDLSIEEMRAVLRTVTAVAHTSADANRLHSTHFKEGVHETGLQMEQEARNNKTLSGGWARAMLAMQLNPDRFFDAMGDFAKDSAWKALGMEFADGEMKVLEINRDFHTLFADIIGDKAFTKLASYKDADLVDVGVVDVDGKSVKMTRGMMLALYQTITCPGNRQALVDGGIEIPNMKKYYEGKNVDAYAQGTRISRSSYCEAIHDILHQREQASDINEIDRLTRELVRLEEQASAEYDAIAAKIEEQMTDYERQYCELMREWFDNVSKNHINEVTMDVFGFQKAIVERYFPIYRDTNFVANEIDGLVSDITLDSLGSLKSRVRSRAPIKLADATDVLMRNERSIANYCGYLRPMTDMKKLLNVHTQDMRHSVKDTLTKMTPQSKVGLGTTPMEYIKNLMIDIAGGRQNENSLFSALRRNVIRSTMTFNPRVAFKQLGAVFTSAGELGWKYQSKAVQRIGRKLDPAFVAKYSVYFHERMYGSGGMEEFAAMKQGSNVFDRAYRKADELTGGKLFNWCQDVDNYVCKLLWHGCEAKTRDVNPELKPGSEEFYQAVGKELDRVIQKTQTNYTLMERSDLSRDNRWTMKILSTYKTDAIQGFNMLFEANARYRRYKKDFAAGKGGVTQADVDDAKQQLCDTIPAVLTGSVLWGAFAGILMNMLMQRTSGVRDDNDEITAASVGKALLSETLGGMAGMVVFGDQIYDIAASRIFGDSYYGMSDMGLETLSGLLEDFATGDFTNAKTIKYLIQDIGKIAGIPLKNAWDMGEGVAKHIIDISKGEFLTFNADANTTTSQYYRQLYKALQKGDTEKADGIREFLVTCGKTEAEIQAGMRAAVKKDDRDFEKKYQAAMREAMEDMFYRSMTEKEQKKVASGISGYIADQIVAERVGGEMTKANQKAEGYIDKGASVAEYFVANTAKNAEFADENGDGKVSKAEYRRVMSDAEYDADLKRLFLKLKQGG